MDFRQLDVLVESMGRIFNDRICAERLRTRLTVKEELGVCVLAA